MALASMLDRLPRVMGARSRLAAVRCASFAVTRRGCGRRRAASQHRMTCWLLQEQNRRAVRSHWCFGTRTRIRRYERFTAFAYESDACDAETDAAPVTIRI